jgi:hypothetical protein
MAMKDRAAESIGGPDGQSTWWDNGTSFTIQNHAAVSATTTPNNLIMGMVPIPSKAIPGGNNPDALATGLPIQSVSACYLALTAALTAQATLSLTMSIWRSGAQLGGAPLFGWQASGGGTPAFALLTAVSMPALVNPFFTPNGIVLLQPLDLYVVTLQTSAGAVPVPVGSVQTITV